MARDRKNLAQAQKENNLLLSDAKTNNVIQTISLEELQKTYTELKRFPSIQEINSSNFTFSYKNSIEVYNYKTNSSEITISFDDNAQNNEYNSKAKAIAYTLDNNLFIANSTSPKIAVTEISDKNIVSGQAIHRSEFGIYKGTFWSPEGTYLAFYQKDETNVTDYPLVDINTYPASLMNIKYPMAGSTNEIVKVAVYDIQNQKTIYLNTGDDIDQYLTNISWSPDEKNIYISVLNRDQNHLKLNKCLKLR